MPALAGDPSLYPPRDRATNIAIIKAVVYAATEQDFRRARTRFAEDLHPSLFAELDWFEESCPPGQRDAAARHVDGLFEENVDAILERRRPQDVPAAADGASLVEAVHGDLQARLAALTDRDRIPAVGAVALENALLLELDHPVSRVRAKRWVRARGHPFVPQDALDSPRARDCLREALERLSADADAAGLAVLAAAARMLQGFLATADLDRMDRFEGDYQHGRGACGCCAMSFASEGLVALDSTVPWLCTLEDERILVPVFNLSTCIFCGHSARVNTPALFYAPERNQVIYCLPSAGQRTEADSVAFWRPFIEDVRRRCVARYGADRAARFQRAAEVLTYDIPQFLAAIQVGHAEREWHAWNVVRFADGSGAICDGTKGVTIFLTAEELRQRWGAATGAGAPHKVEDAAPGVSMAKAAFEAGRVGEAVAILERHVATCPGDVIARTNLATAYLKLGNRERARKLISARPSGGGL